MAKDSFDYDLLVIGSGPAGQRAAIQGAKLDKQVAIVERKAVLGGCSINLGTIPSKTLREAVLELSGYRSREFYGASYTVKQNITIQDLLSRTNRVIHNELDVTGHQLMRNDVELVAAEASFAGPDTVRLDHVDGSASRMVKARKIVIAAGTETTRDPHIPFDGKQIFTSDDILHLDRLPRTLAVVGAGVIGCEYASIFAALGVRVTLIDKRDRLLPFVDAEIADTLCHHLRENRATLRLNESVNNLEVVEDEHGARVRLHLDSGKTVHAEKALYSVGRTGATGSLNLEGAGLTPDSRGRLTVDEHHRIEIPHIYAVGDVIGLPALASTSMEQGRLAVCHAFGVKARSVPENFPYGISTAAFCGCARITWSIRWRARRRRVGRRARACLREGGGREPGRQCARASVHAAAAIWSISSRLRRVPEKPAAAPTNSSASISSFSTNLAICRSRSAAGRCSFI